MKDLSEEVRITVWPKFANSPILTAFKRLRITTNVSNAHAEAAKAAEEAAATAAEEVQRRIDELQAEIKALNFKYEAMSAKHDALLAKNADNIRR